MSFSSRSVLLQNVKLNVRKVGLRIFRKVSTSCDVRGKNLIVDLGALSKLLFISYITLHWFLWIKNYAVKLKRINKKEKLKMHIAQNKTLASISKHACDWLPLAMGLPHLRSPTLSQVSPLPLCQHTGAWEISIQIPMSEVGIWKAVQFSMTWTVNSRLMEIKAGAGKVVWAGGSQVRGWERKQQKPGWME